MLVMQRESSMKFSRLRGSWARPLANPSRNTVDATLPPASMPTTMVYCRAVLLLGALYLQLVRAVVVDNTKLPLDQHGNKLITGEAGAQLQLNCRIKNAASATEHCSAYIPWLPALLGNAVHASGESCVDVPWLTRCARVVPSLRRSPYYGLPTGVGDLR